MEHLNTFKINKPANGEFFSHEFWIYNQRQKTQFGFMLIPITMRVHKLPATYFLDLFIDFTDYTLYNPAKDIHGRYVPISFHHLN